MSLEVKAGQGLAIIGPSGGGKTTLVRALTGIWPVLRGSVRLDNADPLQWKEEVLGRYVGYLPQEVALMDGTIVENISRFAPKRDGKGVVAAAMAAGVHELIVRLPDGYDTPLGSQGTALSAGQRQRIGLARALYGDPFVVVLDEPNAFLDTEGEQALNKAIAGIKKRGGIVIVVAHRPSVLEQMDLVAVVQAGKLTAFGTKAQVLGAQQAPERSKPNLQPVRAAE